MLPTLAGSNPQPPRLQSDGASNWATEAGISRWRGMGWGWGGSRFQYNILSVICIIVLHYIFEWADKKKQKQKTTLWFSCLWLFKWAWKVPNLGYNFAWNFLKVFTTCLRTAKALAGLCLCAGLPESLLVTYLISTLFSCAGSFKLPFFHSPSTAEISKYQKPRHYSSTVHIHCSSDAKLFACQKTKDGSQICMIGRVDFNC